MYDNVRCRVRGDGWISAESFESNRGVKQGCPLSPLLFGLYIDGLDDAMGGARESPKLQGMEVPFPAFADDVVLLSTSAAGLQRKLARLQDFSEESGLSVNLQKTEVVVFGGQFAMQKEKNEFSYAGERVAIVQSFRYLGVQFHCNGTFREGAQVLAAAGRKAAFCLERRCEELGVRKVKTRVNLFDTLVGPILGYGAEVWGPGYGPRWGWNGEGDCAEKVHRGFLRGLLRVRKSTLSKAVLGEFGRFPVVIHRWEQIFKFANRISKLTEDRLARLAYEESKVMWAAGEGGWFAEVVEKARELAFDDQFAGGFDVKSLRI